MKKICFLVGSMAISGGTYVIVQHAAYLQRAGYDVTLAVQETFNDETLSWHDEACSLRCIPFEQGRAERFDLVIATWWKTALELPSFSAPRYAYFVQSIESRFYPEAEAPLRALVDATYKLPVGYVTEAAWIQEYLKSQYAQDAQLVLNGIRKDVYNLSGPVVERRPANETPRVLVEGHFGVPFKNTALALRLAREAGARDLWVLTGSPVKWLPGVHRVFSRVPMTRTADIYRSCDILVKLSTVEGMFGPPLEMFHCGGTAVVFDVSGHEEYIVDGINACVIPDRNPDLVVNVLRDLLNDRKTLERLKRGALATAGTWPSWEESSREFARWVDTTLARAAIDRQECAAIVAEAFSTYESGENLRLSSGRGFVTRHKFRSLAAKLPSKMVRVIKELEAAVEVMSVPRIVR